MLRLGKLLAELKASLADPKRGDQSLTGTGAGETARDELAFQ
jgi:hypothetical protein